MSEAKSMTAQPSAGAQGEAVAWRWRYGEDWYAGTAEPSFKGGERIADEVRALVDREANGSGSNAALWDELKLGSAIINASSMRGDASAINGHTLVMAPLNGVVKINLLDIITDLSTPAQPGTGDVAALRDEIRLLNDERVFWRGLEPKPDVHRHLCKTDYERELHSLWRHAERKADIWRGIASAMGYESKAHDSVKPTDSWMLERIAKYRADVAALSKPNATENAS